jgi:hypothetical protein
MGNPVKGSGSRLTGLPTASSGDRILLAQDRRLAIDQNANTAGGIDDHALTKDDAFERFQFDP